MYRRHRFSYGGLEPKGKIRSSFCFLAEFLSMSIFLKLASRRVVITRSGWIIKYYVVVNNHPLRQMLYLYEKKQLFTMITI